MKDLQQDTNGTKKTGAEGFLNELDNLLGKIADDFKKASEGKSNFSIIGDSDLMETVLKFVNYSDKIKKMVVRAEPEENEDKKAVSKVTNIQDLALNAKKGA